jgi:hypothetical protein
MLLRWQNCREFPFSNLTLYWGKIYIVEHNKTLSELKQCSEQVGLVYKILLADHDELISCISGALWMAGKQHLSLARFTE